jgi:hypothetical protein
VVVDAVSQGRMDSPREVRMPLATRDSGKRVRGRYYVADFYMKM